MFNRLSFISTLLLFSLWSQPQSKVHPVIVKPTTITSISRDITRLELVEFAKSFLGTTYLYASLDPTRGFDCSGFVYYVFNHFKIPLPRSSREYAFLRPAKEPEDFKEGDIIIFYGFRDTKQIGHVGIICEANGMKSKFIHSSSGKVRGVTISQLDLVQYTRRFYKCIDVIGL